MNKNQEFLQFDQNIVKIIDQNSSEVLTQLNKEKLKIALQITGVKISLSVAISDDLFQDIYQNQLMSSQNDEDTSLKNAQLLQKINQGGEFTEKLSEQSLHDIQCQESEKYEASQELKKEKYYQADCLQELNITKIKEEKFQECISACFVKRGYDQEKANKYYLRILLASQIIDKKFPLIILLGGTSGTGKSTVGSIMAAKFGISTALSTDSIRQIMRNFLEKEDCPALFVSTYQAGAALPTTEQKVIQSNPDNPDQQQQQPVPYEMSEQEKTIKGYKLQCSVVQERLEGVIDQYAKRREPIVIEGVHLTPNFMLKMMKKYKQVIPFTICIKDEKKHKERFAVRSKYMTLDKRHNKYIKNFMNIRFIQKWFLEKTDQYLIPKVNNVNIDKSVGIIHKTILRYQYKLSKQQIKFKELKNALPLYEEYNKATKNIWSGVQIKNLLESKVNRIDNIQRYLTDVLQNQSNNDRKISMSPDKYSQDEEETQQQQKQQQQQEQEEENENQDQEEQKSNFKSTTSMPNEIKDQQSSHSLRKQSSNQIKNAPLTQKQSFDNSSQDNQLPYNGYQRMNQKMEDNGKANKRKNYQNEDIPSKTSSTNQLPGSPKSANFQILSTQNINSPNPFQQQDQVHAKKIINKKNISYSDKEESSSSDGDDEDDGEEDKSDDDGKNNQKKTAHEQENHIISSKNRLPDIPCLEIIKLQKQKKADNMQKQGLVKSNSPKQSDLKEKDNLKQIKGSQKQQQAQQQPEKITVQEFKKQQKIRIEQEKQEKNALKQQQANDNTQGCCAQRQSLIILKSESTEEQSMRNNNNDTNNTQQRQGIKRIKSYCEEDQKKEEIVVIQPTQVCNTQGQNLKFNSPQKIQSRLRGSSSNKDQDKKQSNNGQRNLQRSYTSNMKDNTLGFQDGSATPVSRSGKVSSKNKGKKSGKTTKSWVKVTYQNSNNEEVSVKPKQALNILEKEGILKAKLELNVSFGYLKKYLEFHKMKVRFLSSTDGYIIIKKVNEEELEQIHQNMKRDSEKNIGEDCNSSLNNSKISENLSDFNENENSVLNNTNYSISEQVSEISSLRMYNEEDEMEFEEEEDEQLGHQVFNQIQEEEYDSENEEVYDDISGNEGTDEDIMENGMDEDDVLDEDNLNEQQISKDNKKKNKDSKYTDQMSQYSHQSNNSQSHSHSQSYSQSDIQNRKNGNY